MSLKLKINILLFLIGVITSICIGVFNYYEAKDRVFSDAFQKAELISSFAMASREYTVKTMRPLAREIAGSDSFHPELMGGFFVARAIADNFAKTQPGYIFKQATLNPVNSDNQADFQEIEIINYFDANPEIKMRKGLIEKNGQRYFYIANPVEVKKGCLKCHGAKENAPAGRVRRYPGPGGYNYEINNVVASFVNYVPIDKALDDLKITAFKTAMAGILSVLLILTAVWFFIGTMVTKPIIRLTNLADSMSRGKELEKEITVSSADEIGALCVSFNRMRKSVLKLIKIIRQNKA